MPLRRDQHLLRVILSPTPSFPSIHMHHALASWPHGFLRYSSRHLHGISLLLLLSMVPRTILTSSPPQGTPPCPAILWSLVFTYCTHLLYTTRRRSPSPMFPHFTCLSTSTQLFAVSDYPLHSYYRFSPIQLSTGLLKEVSAPFQHPLDMDVLSPLRP